MQLHRSIAPYFSHKDARGSICGLLAEGAWREVNLITSEAGTTRGRHFQRDTEECYVILMGKIQVSLRLPTHSGDQIDSVIVSAGDVFAVPPLVEHTFHVLENAQWINLLSKPMDSVQPDFHRYPEP